VNAGLARSVVDAALQSWSRVISNFNYSDGSNNFDISIAMAATGTSLGANAGTSSYDGSKPRSGGMTIGRGNDLNGDGKGDGGAAGGGPSDTGHVAHSAALGATVVSGGKTYISADDMMDPYYTFGQRRVVPQTMALLLHDAYGYTVVNPATFGTYYAVLNQST